MMTWTTNFSIIDPPAQHINSSIVVVVVVVVVAVVVDNE